ncbi:ATP-binding cassette domain-containing protein [Neisseriaceae bacterium ESL0693]|nr:ATP-binding cassette domain-containing protein [Neisseriaceae bacterium ESL0693]
MKPADTLWQQDQLRLSRLMSSRRKVWLLAWLLGFLTALAGVALLALAGWFITAAAVAGIVSLSTAYTFNYLIPAGVIRFLAIGRTAGRYGERLTAHDAVLSLLADLRSGLFARLAHRHHDAPASVSQMHRLTSDIDLLNGWPLNMLLPFGWVVGSVLVFMLLLWLSMGLPAASMISMPCLVAAFMLPGWGVWYGRRWGLHQVSMAEERRQALLMPLSALTALVQWQQWPRFVHRFNHTDDNYLTDQHQQQRFCDRIVLAQQSCLIIAAGLLLWCGAGLMQSQKLSAAWLLALFLALLGLSELILSVGRQVTVYGLCSAACQRLNALIAPESAATMTDAMAAPLPAHIELQAKHVSVCHAGAVNGITDLSFSLKSGEVLLIQGASGVGKSTLLAALAGEIPLQQGSFECLGYPMTHWQWQGQLAYLAQEPDIFDLTLAENLRLGLAKATDDQLWQVLDWVALADWARAQPQQLHTPLGEYGCAVSGGQARRIALARLLLKPYALMLLDEPFAGLDDQTADELAHMLVRQQQHGLLVLVSHQPLPDDLPISTLIL